MEQINQALASVNPLQLIPSVDENGHGTYISSLAAGGENFQNNFIGAAPQAQIAMVKLKEAKEYLRDFFFVREGATAFQENDVMAGIAYLDQLAYQLNKPLVLCIGIGTNTGSHGGNGPVANMLEDVARKRLRSVAIAAGNEANKRHHFYGNILPDAAYENVEISVGANVTGFVTELWAQAPELYSIEIISPTGERVRRNRGVNVKSFEYTFIFENTTVSIDNRISIVHNGAQIIFIRFERPSQGIWTVRVFPEDTINGIFQMWLPLESMLSGEVFFIRSNPDITLTIPSNAATPMTVGGYDSNTNSIYLDSSRGYTVTGLIKPDFVAPAVDILGAGRRNQFVSATGTCAAAAITAGAVALIMEWAVVRENYSIITSSDIKNILIRGAKRDPDKIYPNREWGDYVNIVPS